MADCCLSVCRAIGQILLIALAVPHIQKCYLQTARQSATIFQAVYGDGRLVRIMPSIGFSSQRQPGAYMLTNNKGFTLIELTVVVAVIGILAAVAIPNFIAYRDKAYLCEGYALSDPVRKEVVEYYDHVGAFPPDNATLGFPEAIRGKYVGSIKVKDGAVEIKYRDDSRQSGVTITLRPVVSSDDPTGPVTWEEEKIAKTH